MGEKWLELLKEISPRVSRAALVFNPDTIPVQAAADKFAVEVVVAPVRDLAQIEAVMTRVGREQDGGLILPPDSFTAAHRKLIVELAARYRVPAVYSFRFFAAEGGLISYGIDLVDQFRRAAAYVDRILKGEKPANSAGGAAFEIRTGDQSQDRQGTRPRRALVFAAARRRGDRMKRRARDWADPEGWVETALAQLARHHWTLMVLQDVRSGAMRHLDRFLVEVKERGGRLRQEFPGSCLPITCGRITGPLADFVSPASERSLDRTAPLGSHEL